MRAAVLNSGRILVRDDVSEPVPAQGQVLVAVKACGICGSDLHFAKYGQSMLDLGAEMAGPNATGAGGLDLARDVFMGHEFSAEILEVGPDTQTFKPGTVVTSIPNVVYSNDRPAGYGERMVLYAPMLLEVPNGLDPRHAALTEPMAVGLHAVNRSKIEPGEGALVLGCGPVGIACIAALKLQGIEPIVGADFSPARRDLALKLGAHESADPAVEPSFDAYKRVAGNKPLVAYDAIGVPGIIDGVFKAAPRHSRLLVVGVCMGKDSFTPYWGISKELTVTFALGYTPAEFSGTLKSIADGDYDVSPIITGEVGIDGVAGAFDDLGNPDKHCKILVTP